MKTLIVERRFQGPDGSSNGGYFAGLVASLAHSKAPSATAVKLHQPPPLDTEMEVVELPEGRVEIRHGERVIGSAQPAKLELTVADPPGYLEVIDASRNYAGFTAHRFPNCFVCGPQRVRGDGMRVFAGPIPLRDVVAAPWVPDASLDRGDGKVRPEFMSAALDCPGYFAVVSDDRMLLLGQITSRVDRLVHVGESCSIVGWSLGGSGRKFEAGTAIFDGDGELCGKAHAVWIEPKAAT